VSETEKPKHNPQRKVWESIKVLGTYESAKALSDSLDRETKIRRCGTGGTKFKVVAVKKYLEEK